MAAYGALTCVMHIIRQIQQHPHPPISFDKLPLESLTINISFLQEFLEDYSHVSQDLESRIADAAYAAEDIIETHVVDQIHVGSLNRGKRISSVALHESLHKVIEDMDSIKKEVIREVKDKQNQLHKIIPSAGLSRPPESAGQKSSTTTMVGFDEVLYQVKDKLTGGESRLQIISIVGMGGIGKTTLARNVFADPVLDRYFDILAWVTVSQEWTKREILLQLLKEGGNSSRADESELGERLYRRLYERRYLIILDDIWDMEVLDKLKFHFPDNKNTSRVVVTTRLHNLTSHLPSSSVGIELKLLDEDSSWKLFSKVVFGEEGFPLDLMEIGKKIVRNCRGLPLSIVAIGGLLAKFKPTQEYWEHVMQNLNSIVNSEDDERCLRILKMSYNQLPVHLKPCFLYMGVFKEDRTINVSMLVKLWVAEGFLKPIAGKSLEEIAREYLRELVERNLILVQTLGLNGSIKSCIIHDLVRDLCLREAHRDGFYYTINQHVVNSKRRIILPNSTSKEEVVEALQCIPLGRSLICHTEEAVPSLSFRLMRILKTFDERFGTPKTSYLLENVFQLVNLRYLSVLAPLDSVFPSSICHLWNLSTLIVDTHSDQGSFTAPVEIWGMPQLRHLCFDRGFSLLDPPSGTIALDNLCTLSIATNFVCSEEVVKRIPNIKKLVIQYNSQLKEVSHYCLHNLKHLHKLNYFGCFSDLTTMPAAADFLHHIAFPQSIKKLIIGGTHVLWDADILERIASLPFLEKLRLLHGVFDGHKWETVEGQFDKLRFLEMDSCGVEYWTTETSHFPCLEIIRLVSLNDLKEIPLEIGEISTLRSIELIECNDGVAISARRMLDELEDLLGEVSLQVRVEIPMWGAAEMLKLATPNFRVEF